MIGSYLTNKQRAAILAEYLSYQVQVQGTNMPAPGVLEAVDYLDFTKPARVQVFAPGSQHKWVYPTVEDISPVLYDLADLPRLPQRIGEDATPLVVVLRKLNFTTSLDLGAGEGVIAAEVIPNQSGKVADRTTLLHLRVHTGYIDPDSREEGDGCEYEVTLSAFGEVMWRNTTADKLSIDEAARTGRGHWQHAHGTHLLRAWDYLHELHVAVGTVAETERHPVNDTYPYETRYRYVRKQLPVQEGAEQQ